MRILKSESIHKDVRRSIHQLVTTDIKQVNLYEVNQNSILGNHYHKLTNEYFYILRGLFMLKVNGKSSVVGKGYFFVVEPEERHSIECVSKNGSFFTFLTKPYSENDTDTYK